MVSPTPWPEFHASDSPLDQLVKLSHFYGSDIEFVIAGGGNTSVKIGDRIFVKGSGTSLATITAEGFVELDRSAMGALLALDLGEDAVKREDRFKQAILAARIQPEKGQRPSVECVLHNLLPRRFVVHTHSTLANMISCCRAGEALAIDILGDDVLWIPYVDPGYILAKKQNEEIARYARRTGNDCPPAVLMQNHGLIVCGDSPEEIREQTTRIISKIRTLLRSLPLQPAFGPTGMLNQDRASALVEIIAPCLRALLATGDSLKIVTFDDSKPVMELVAGQDGKAAALGGPLTPDQIVYCNSFPVWFEPRSDESDSDLIGRLKSEIETHHRLRNSPPLVVLVKELGMFALGDDYAAADTARLVYADIIKVMAGAGALGGIHPLPTREREFIEQWEVEAYRRKVAASERRLGCAAGKVALITGAAQGFGLEIARELAWEGAHVALADINEQAVFRHAEQLSDKCGLGRASGLRLDVTNTGSIAAAVHEVVRTYGGLDLLVSNAGVLLAGSVKTQTKGDFEAVTNVNYTGYFLCVQKVAPVMARQHQCKPDYMSDIIQINSKSGLVGSNRNGAYAGSKFGGIGLTESFALELITDGIKVNAICPGNFFEGPLWSDPEKGLFVQYLRTGKVPGAASIEDVKRFYESKVPMGRGCRTADVVKAIYYLMDQKYETGQALPVTGGQVMLH